MPPEYRQVKQNGNSFQKNCFTKTANKTIDYGIHKPLLMNKSNAKWSCGIVRQAPRRDPVRPVGLSPAAAGRAHGQETEAGAAGRYMVPAGLPHLRPTAARREPRVRAAGRLRSGRSAKVKKKGENYVAMHKSAVICCAATLS